MTSRNFLALDRLQLSHLLPPAPPPRVNKGSLRRPGTPAIDAGNAVPCRREETKERGKQLSGLQRMLMGTSSTASLDRGLRYNRHQAVAMGTLGEAGGARALVTPGSSASPPLPIRQRVRWSSQDDDRGCGPKLWH